MPRSSVRTRIACVLSLAGLVTAGCSTTNIFEPSTSSAPYSQRDLVVGTGPQAVTGNRVTVSYTGWLHDVRGPDGKGTEFDTSTGFTFVLGAGTVIRGWDVGLLGMRVGGLRRLVIPPDLAYGISGTGTIPPAATLVFDVNLLAIE